MDRIDMNEEFVSNAALTYTLREILYVLICGSTAVATKNIDFIIYYQFISYVSSSLHF